jgi:hypothetical protein
VSSSPSSYDPFANNSFTLFEQKERLFDAEVTALIAGDHELQLSSRRFRENVGGVDDGNEVSHFGRVAFEIDRLALALLANHGLQVEGLADRGSQGSSVN